MKLSLPVQLSVAAFLALLMAATRGHHFASLEYLPSASWAVFFLAGVYLRPVWFFPAFLLEAVLLDYSAITWGGVSSFCVTPAYSLLLPAYGSLWLAGRWFAGHYREQLSCLWQLAVAVLAGAAICELLSSGGFYFFSGRFADPQMAEFGARLLKYFPAYLTTITGYVALAALLHICCLVAVRKLSGYGACSDER